MSNNALSLIKTRIYMGRLSALILCILLLGLLDGCIAKVRQPLNLFYMIAGETIAIDGNIEERVEDYKLIGYRSSSPLLRLNIEAVQRGYWLGGNMWIGTVTASQNITEGEYSFVVFNKNTNKDLQSVPHRIIVYKSESDLNRNSLSFIQKSLNISPWLFAILCLPFTIVALSTSYWLSWKIDNLLKTQGIFEIYQKLFFDDNSLLISFDFGTKSTLTVGDKVDVLDPFLKRIGNAVILEIKEKDAVAKTSVGENCSYVALTPY